MSKGFNYSKWDNIELSDDEDDVHPNIDRESWFRMKHRSRVEREEKEDVDKKKINAEMSAANLRIKEIERILARAAAAAAKAGDDDGSDSDDDLEDLDGLRAELASLRSGNAANQAKLDDYEKHKKWNVDNMSTVTAERTIVNQKVAEQGFSESGYALPPAEVEKGADSGVGTKTEGGKTASMYGPTGAAEPKKDVEVTTEQLSGAKISSGGAAATVEPTGKSIVPAAKKTLPASPEPVNVAMLTYHEFTEKYADVVEQFMAISSLEKSKDFLLQKGDILLQENASNYLLLASLEDEMNGYHEKMKLVARQSQIISNIAELAKSLKGHPGNVIVPFFERMQRKELFEGFMDSVNTFVKKIEIRAVEKRKEMDADRVKEVQQRGGDADGAVDVSEIPLEERLGPGGLDPLEVFESLPESLQAAFESREKEQLEKALLGMTPEKAEYHMKRCMDSGLWNS